MGPAAAASPTCAPPARPPRPTQDHGPPPALLIRLRVLPSAPSTWAHFPNSPASAASSSDSSRPLRPPGPHPVPSMGKAAAAQTHAPSRAGRGEEQLAGPSSCEVWGCQGEEPGLRGRHGKAARECYPEPPPARCPVLLPLRIPGLRGALGGGRGGSQPGRPRPVGHRLWQECPSALAEYRPLGPEDQLAQP